MTEFLAVTGDYLRAERARNTVLLTVTEALRQAQGRPRDGGNAGPGEQPLFGWWVGDEGDGAGAVAAGGPGGPGAAVAAGVIAGAFMHTPA